MFWRILLAAGVAVAALVGCATPDGANVAEKRAAVAEMRADTLRTLYEVEPQAEGEIARAAGFGVFSNIGVNLIFLSAGNGWGVVRDNATGEETYMKMVSAGIGLGLGVKDFRGVFVFTSQDALASFVESGWDASAQADLVAKSDDKGDGYAGAIDVAPGIKLYQLTENGLALQATIQGTKYWKDDGLS